MFQRAPSPRRRLFDHDANLLMVRDKGIVTKGELMPIDELLECLVLMVLPARVVEIFVKHNHAPWPNMRMKEVKYAFCR
jgi:hypothetical protein